MVDEKEVALYSMKEMSTSNGTYPMYFGLSCAFAALQFMKPRGLDLDHGRRDRRSRIAETMLQASACLLGLLMEAAQRRGEVILDKLKAVELEVFELKLRRAEDAKANEKVVGIFAAHEQSWIAERKMLRHRIQVLTSELNSLEAKYEETVSELSKRIEEDDHAMREKQEFLEEEVRNRKELEEKLQLAEEVGEELRERAEKAAQDHLAELWKHKTAFMELVSNQRQLEAEIGRALRQAEAAKEELEEVAEQKEEAMAMVDKLAMEMAKLEKDGEQKDKILSAMLRKSKLDTAEKQMLLKEVKISKAKKKQAELEMKRWRNMWESRSNKSSRAFYEAGSSKDRRADTEIVGGAGAGGGGGGYHPRAPLLEYFEAESRTKHESSVGKAGNSITTVDCYDQYSSERNDEIASIDDIQQLKEWVRLETEKYVTILEERHYEEIEAFTEQMRLKDEKLEALHWRLLSMELETKRLQSHNEGLDGTISQFREENIKLEALLLDKEKELKLVKEQFNFFAQHCPKSSSNYNTSPVAADLQALWSEVRISIRKPKEEEQEVGTNLAIDLENAECHAAKDTKVMQLEAQENKANVYEESVASAITTASSNDFASPNESIEVQNIVCVTELSPEGPEHKGTSSGDQAENITVITQSPNEEIKEEKVVNVDPGDTKMRSNFRQDVITNGKLVSSGESLMKKDHSWKMDIQALGVSYKIKRLKQQLLVLEKLAGEKVAKPTTTEPADPLHVADNPKNRKADDNRQQMKGLLTVISLLNKQVRRYQSLEEKTDDLCRRMHENYRTGGNRDSRSGSTRKQTEALQHFLEETFQLQRFMVATGQKMMEVESRISSCCFSSAGGLDESLGFNFGQFADVARTLFKEVQRGLGVRIARIIGDLEGTLTCDGILHM